MQYLIPQSNLKELEKRVGRLVRRAAKIGSNLTCVVDENTFEDRPHKVTVVRDGKEVEDIRFVRYVSVTVDGDRPKFAGWEFVGTLEHTTEGNIMRLVPGATAPLQYRDQAPQCDHCKAKRTRKDTFLVKHEDGRFVQVGRTCIADFLGHTNPHHIAELASIWINIDELSETLRHGGGNYFNVERYDLMTFLEHVAQITLVKGFVSRSFVKRIQEEQGEFARVPDVTSDLAHRAAFPEWTCKRDRELSETYRPTDEAKKLAEEARNWALRTFGYGLPEGDDADAIKDFLLGGDRAPKELNEFEHNLLVVSRGESVERRTFGIAAYIIQAYRRANNLIPVKAKRPVCTKHFGVKGDRLKEITVVCDKVHTWRSEQFGDGYLFKMLLPDGSLLVWKTYGVSEENNMVEGHTYVLNGTIKDHSEFRGEKQTVLSRVKVLRGVVDFKAALTENEVEEAVAA